VKERSGKTGEPTREQIERRAYELYLARGGADGHDFDDWLRAERELSYAKGQTAADALS
jgi:hypothetical protein